MLSKKQKKSLSRLIPYIHIGTVLLVFVSILSVLVPHKNLYWGVSYMDNFEHIEKVYYNSQYVQENPSGWIPDEIVNAYAGVKYIQGTPPILITPDTPPLGRYLIGLSVILTNNPNYSVLLFTILMYYLLYVAGKSVYKYKTTALLLPLMVSLEPLIRNQLVYTPLLDTFQVAFLLLCLIFFNRALVKNARVYLWFSLASAMLGLFISTKFFATGVTIIIACYVVLLINKRLKDMVRLTVVLPIAILVLLSTYSAVFTLGYSLREFLGIQRWVYDYHKSQLILPFTIWPLLYLNKWYVWWGDTPVISDDHWRISWPVITSLTLIATPLYYLKKVTGSISIQIYMVWSVVYLLFFSLGQVTSRYLIILIPILYLVSLYIIEQLVVLKLSNNDNKN